MSDPLAQVQTQTLMTALRGYYRVPEAGGTVAEGKELVELLTELPSLSRDENVDPILVKMEKHHPGISLAPHDYTLLAFVDDAITRILRQTDLDFRIEAFVRDLAPRVAIAALQADIKALTQNQGIYELIDTMIKNCIGWSEDLGFLGEQFMDPIDAVMREMIRGKTGLEDCKSQLEEYFAKERPIFTNMERRLCDSEMDVIAGARARYQSAEALNQAMTNQQLPLFIIFMLQGSWYEFLQQVYVHHGQKSKAWETVLRLTNALIKSLQPGMEDESRKKAMATLPGQVKAFCEQMSFDTQPVVQCLEEIQCEYDLITQNTPSDPCGFELLETDASLQDSNATASQEITEQIAGLKAGQWFLFDDKEESDEKVARILLILNWEDSERLLFTNHNRRKVLHMTYAELAAYLAAGTVRKLTPERSAARMVQTHLVSIIQGIQQQKKKEVELAQAEERRQLSKEFVEQRQETMSAEADKQQKIADAKHKRALVLREKARKKMEAAEEAVGALRVDAWVKLPIMEGTLTPCKLVAHIAAADKYIFANRAGIKVAEYTSGQLSNMIVTENSEILDTGAEFESVLASVVSGLREDKNKSYAELTGDREGQ